MGTLTEDQSIVVVALANAALGIGVRLHDEDHVVRVLTKTAAMSSAGSSVDPIHFLANLQDCCHGAPGPRAGYPSTVAIRGGSPHLFKSDSDGSCLDKSPDDYVSQVVDWRTLVGMMPDPERIKFDLASPSPPPPSDVAWKDLLSLEASTRSRRRFSPIANSYWPAKPVHWWTPRSNVERVLSSTSHSERANALRDKLGLYYGEHDASGTDKAWARNLRFVLHVRVQALLTVGHFRPNFVEAGGYCRFAVHRHGAVPDPVENWGNTVDLGILRASGEIEDGLPERVSPTLVGIDLGPGQIEFDFLGGITSGCGETSIDSHGAFALGMAGLVNKHMAHLEPSIENWKAVLPVTL